MRVVGIFALALVAACGGGDGVSAPADPNDAINGQWRFAARSECSNTYFDLQRNGTAISGTVTFSPCAASPVRTAVQGGIDFPEVVLVWGDPDLGDTFAGAFTQAAGGYNLDRIDGAIPFSDTAIEAALERVR